MSQQGREQTMVKNRWYDKDPKTSAAVETILKMPPEIQSIICQGILLLAEKEFTISEKLQNFKSLGTEKVLALYKSKQKKRAYDRHIKTHTAMNYLGFLSPENQTFMAARILEMMELLRDYLSICQYRGAIPANQDITALTDVYVESGVLKARNFLQTLEQKFMEGVRKKAQTIEKLEELEKGMTVRNSKD